MEDIEVGVHYGRHRGRVRYGRHWGQVHYGRHWGRCVMEDIEIGCIIRFLSYIVTVRFNWQEILVRYIEDIAACFVFVFLFCLFVCSLRNCTQRHPFLSIALLQIVDCDWMTNFDLWRDFSWKERGETYDDIDLITDVFVNHLNDTTLFIGAVAICSIKSLNQKKTTLSFENV